mmetsp:Transcript_18647/g.39178  ORF Transcript_18647/g.39178 Transcript_18647/m.39178 type:complete len:508 (-) Transcript_18647:2316-3839(-)
MDDETDGKTGDELDEMDGLMEDLFEEMRRLVGFKRNSRSGPMEGAEVRPLSTPRRNGASLHSPASPSRTVEREVTKNELRMLVLELKKMNPSEHGAGIRALERRNRELDAEVTELRRRVKEVRRQTESTSQLDQLQKGNKEMEEALAKANSENASALAEIANLKHHLKRVKRMARNFRARAEAKEKVEDQETLRLAEISSLNKKLEKEAHQARENRKQLETTLATVKRLEALVKDLRADVIEQHHTAVSKGIEARQARTILEALEKEYSQMKSEYRAQTSQLHAKIREMYAVQESMISEIKILQDSKDSPVIRSLAQKTVQLRNLARSIFKSRTQVRNLVLETEEGITMAEESANPNECLTDKSLLSPSTSIADGTGRLAPQTRSSKVESHRGFNVALTQRGKARPEIKRDRRRKGVYEAMIQRSKEATSKDVAEMHTVISQKDARIFTLEDTIKDLQQRLEASEQRLEESRQTRVRDVRNFSQSETEVAAEFEILGRSSKTPSLFS